MNADAAGVHVLRTLEDADSIREEAARADHCIVVGGGMVGLKAAWALQRMGIQVTVVVESEQVLSRVADQAASKMLAESFQAQGTRFCYRSVVRELEVKRGRVSAVLLGNGLRIPAQLVIAAKGVRANLDFIRQSGVLAGEGVEVDSLMQTSHPDVYAAGDVAEVEDRLGGGPRIFALWPHAAEQGRIAARSLLGEVRKYTGAIAMNSVVFYGRPYVFLGNAVQPVSTECRAYSYDAGNGVYRKILLREKTLVGAILAGSIDCAGMICWDIRSGRKIEDPQAYLTRDELVGTLLLRAERPLSFSQ